MLVQVNMGILRWHLFCYFDSSKLPPTKIAHGFGVRFLLCLYVKKHVVVGNRSVMLRRTRDANQIFFVAEKRFVPILQPIVCFERPYTPYIWYFFSLFACVGTFCMIPMMVKRNAAGEKAECTGIQYRVLLRRKKRDKAPMFAMFGGGTCFKICF